MAMSWRGGRPLLGRPTRRARRSSASVDSGMSEKSIALSGIGLALFAARRARADDSDRFLTIFFPSMCRRLKQSYPRSKCRLACIWFLVWNGPHPANPAPPGPRRSSRLLRTRHHVFRSSRLPSGCPRQIFINVYTVIETEKLLQRASACLASERLRPCT